MIWICLIFIVLIVFGCYVTYKEAKHHELHKVRACFEDKHHKIEELLENAEKEHDEEVERIFLGELRGIEEALEMINKEDADCDVIQEIEDDMAKIKEKLAGLFKK